MTRISMMWLTVVLAMPTVLYADINDSNKSIFPVTNWHSANSNDSVTIQNGAGTPIVIVINVDNNANNASGVIVRNCGTTTYIKAGSSTVCETNDNTNPVTLASDSGSLPASGTYQLKQK